MNIAILIPVCSRNQSYIDISSVPFITQFYPSFLRTCDSIYGSSHNYTIFIGYDDDDEFYKANIHKLEEIDNRIRTIQLSECQHSPPKAWNAICKYAHDYLNYDYYFQVGDDIVMECNGWTDHFVKRLLAYNNIGIVGPCNWVNYNQRVYHGRKYVIENAFVSRRHIDIFGYLFEPSIINWYCDDWITRIYDDIFCEIQLNYKCTNSIIDTRYMVALCPDINTKIQHGKQTILDNLNG